MSLREDIVNYRQNDGLVSPDYRPTPDSTGNGLLYLSLYFILLHRRNEIEDTDFIDFYKTVLNCRVPSYPGLFYRSFTKIEEQEGWDDYIGLVYASSLLNAPFANEVLLYGQSHKKYLIFRFFYNDLQPDNFTFKSWFGRNFAVISHFFMCATIRKVPFLLKILGNINLYFQRESILGWIMHQAKGNVGTLNIKQYIEKELGIDHPISKYWI